MCFHPAVVSLLAEIVTLDNIATNALARFDRAHARPDERLRITSVENNAVIPNNLQHLIVEWEAPEDYSTAFLIELKSNSRTLEVLLRKRMRWQTDDDELAAFRNDRELTLTVYRLNRGETTKSSPVRVVISECSLRDRILYREVPIYFIPGAPVSIEQLFLCQTAPLRLLRVEQACVGCHAYSGDSVIFNCVEKRTRKAVTLQRNGGGFRTGGRDFGSFSFVALSPNGRYAAVVKSAQGKLTTRHDIIEPFDLVYKSADVYIYDFETDSIAPLPGASDPRFNEDMPAFSPDGSHVIFSRYQSLRRGFNDFIIESMDLYQVPFNGGKGGVATPVPNASANHLYQYFARYSPNGKWISFCRANGQRGIFARKESDIYLLSLHDHAVRKLSLNCEHSMDSWHDWSSDSRWLVFSSKRNNDNLTALYLSHMDDNGRSHPPIKISHSSVGKMNTPLFAPASLNLETSANISDYIYRCLK